MKRTIHWKDVDHYIAGQPALIQPRLRELRAVIRRAAPAAKEVISYRMPTYKLNGIVAHFSGFKNHYSLFPTAAVIHAFRDRLGDQVVGKGTVRFPAHEPVPARLVADMIRFRTKLNLGNANSAETAKRVIRRGP